MSYNIISPIFSAQAGSIADEKEQSSIKELFKLKVGAKKEELIFYRA